MLFQQFSNITTYIRVVGKLWKQQFWCIVVIQSRGQGLHSCWKWGQICPLVVHLLKTLSSGLKKRKNTLKCFSNIYPTILIYMLTLENCRDKVFLKCNEGMISECNICKRVISYQFFLHVSPQGMSPVQSQSLQFELDGVAILVTDPPRCNSTTIQNTPNPVKLP